MGEKISMQLETITPSKAIEMLANWVPKPRPLIRCEVERLKHDMKAGVFVVTGESIIIDSEGCGSDGRHRLTACVESGVTIRSVVVRGIPETATPNTDRGTSRNVGQCLILAGIDPGIAGARNFAGAIAWTWRLSKRLVSVGAGQRGTGTGHNAPTLHESLETLERYPAVSAGCALAGHAKGRGVLAAIYAMVEAEKGKTFTQFAKGFVSGADLAPGSPILLLRNRLITSREDGVRRKESLPMSLQSALIVKAWNGFAVGTKSMKILRARIGDRSGKGGESFPDIAFARYWP